MRLRQYFGIRFFDNKRDATTNTDFPIASISKEIEDEEDELKVKKIKSKRRSRYKPKTDLKKRGPKPTPKVNQKRNANKFILTKTAAVLHQASANSHEEH